MKPRLPHPSRRTVITGGIALVACGLLAGLKPQIDAQTQTADAWGEETVAAITYDATAHLRLVAATGPWVGDVTDASEGDLIALADQVAAEQPDGSAAAEANRCRREARHLWWPEAAGATKKACTELDKHVVAFARRDVLDAYTHAIADVCGTVKDEAEPGYPLVDHYPYADPADPVLTAHLAAIDRRLSEAPKDCTPQVEVTIEPRDTGQRTGDQR